MGYVFDYKKSDSDRIRYVFDLEKSDLEALKIVGFGSDSQISAPSLRLLLFIKNSI